MALLKFGEQVSYNSHELSNSNSNINEQFSAGHQFEDKWKTLAHFLISYRK